MDVISDELTGNAEYVDQQVYIDRLTQCNKCEHLKTLIPLAGGNCSVCGCFVKAKAKYKPSQCPDSPPRWLAIPLKS